MGEREPHVPEVPAAQSDVEQSAQRPRTNGSPAPADRPLTVRVRRLSAAAQVPARAYPGDAAFDLHAAESCTLTPGARAVVGCGIALELPPGTAALTLPRSGLAARHGLTLVNAPGLIDPGYRGEVRLILQNGDRSASFTVAVGDRIAQLLIVGLPAVRLDEAQELSGSERSERGFGSSGV